MKAKAKSNKIKTVIIASVCVAAALALCGILFALPTINAKNRLSEFKTAILSYEVERIIVSREQAYESGSFDEVRGSFEKLLSDDEKGALRELVESTAEDASFTEENAGLPGIFDYKIAFSKGSERYTMYVSNDGIYFTNGALRICFECKNDLYLYLENMKNTYFN